MKSQFLVIVITFLLFSFISAIAGQPVIKLAASEWPPYVANTLPGNGYVYTIVTEAYKKSGYQPVVKFYSWQAAEDLVKNNNDAVFPSYNRNGVNNLACSAALTGGPVGLYKKKTNAVQYTVEDPGLHQAEAFQGLQKYRFGIVKGYLNTVAFDQASYLQKFPVVDDLANLQQLEQGKVDFAFIDVFVAEYLKKIHKPTYDDLVFMGPSLENKKIYVCFSTKLPGYQEKLAAFNQGLKALNDSGEIDKIINQVDY